MTCPQKNMSARLTHPSSPVTVDNEILLVVHRRELAFLTGQGGVEEGSIEDNGMRNVRNQGGILSEGVWMRNYLVVNQSTGIYTSQSYHSIQKEKPFQHSNNLRILLVRFIVKLGIRNFRAWGI